MGLWMGRLRLMRWLGGWSWCVMAPTSLWAGVSRLGKLTGVEDHRAEAGVDIATEFLCRNDRDSRAGERWPGSWKKQECERGWQRWQLAGWDGDDTIDALISNVH